ncbi:MAG: vitamin B12-dependent ribonucleotide reductase [Candidatus Sungbacteria bacterium]|uniref:Vitamin B12-dependent ribonucleotide reductase n=1 Tax=Candidatus Sungiibacteriota bacterium TaxID=2750080 RepID=A0A931SE24_9BACT|nr:vitamin B12-dependent ribonucleotide reductase [Candidatus Sungbacteria bacterium]
MAEAKLKALEERSAKAPQLQIKRFFTDGKTPVDASLQWVTRSVKMKHLDGTSIELDNLEFPEFWSQNAVQIVATKYFRGKIGTPVRENSARQMIDRVVGVIQAWGEKFGHLKTRRESETFADELRYILLYQKASFNSPVWFNVGVKEHPQCSACFILNVQDNMESILEWIRNEGMIFKYGSGAGVNVSPLRSLRESLSGGGLSSGPLAFMRGADSVASMIKSGGTTRRAAKMVVMNIDHPDIAEFIRCKAEEEKKIRAFMAAGYNMADLNNEAWNSIQYQNANNSVRVTDEFMRAVELDAEWQTRYITTGEVADSYKARDLMRLIAEAAYTSGDPGIQFDTIINDWNTAAHTGRINASNPCSEYMHLDNSACNLASINLMRFLRDDNTFDVEAFKHTVRIIITAQEILVDGSSYPTAKITQNAHDFRELGLGYANLGALLLSIGLPYDSEAAAAWTGALTALMTGEAYRQSAAMAGRVGPFPGYQVNREPMLRVLEKHRAKVSEIKHTLISDRAVLLAAKTVWDEAVELGKQYGVRNSQTTVIAPTGTISFMMDCDSTGIEPIFSHVAMKQLVGGGYMKIVNQVVPRALATLGYSAEEIEDIVNYLQEHGTIEGAPHMKDEHLPVFDCAVAPAKGKRSISWQGHVRVVAAAQPFISGAISKTFNMPYETTPQEIMDSYMTAWKLGIKAFAIYRDGSKAAQPLMSSTGKGGAKEQKLPLQPTKRRLPPTRSSETHKFSIAGHEGYITYSIFEDGTLAEIFIRLAKQGSTLSGLLDTLAISVSMSLQYGVPLKALAGKYIYGRYEPAGVTENPEIPIAYSITDYIFRYLARRFLEKDDLFELGVADYDPDPNNHTVHAPVIPAHTMETDSTAKISKEGVVFADTVCRLCGGMMIQTGSCKTCLQCGQSSGGCV